MVATKKFLQAAAGAAGGAEGLPVDEVFSSYQYTGNGSTQAITNGIDLANEGGMIWIRAREANYVPILTDSTMTRGERLDPSNASTLSSNPTYNITALNTDGFSLRDISSGAYGVNGAPGGAQAGTYGKYSSWTFRKAPRFFDIIRYTGDGSGDRTFSHNLGAEVGVAIVKNLTGGDSYNNNWCVYHRSLGTGQSDYLTLNQATSSGASSGINPVRVASDSSIIIRGGGSGELNVSGVEYVVYLFAHDPLGPSGDGSDGLISCGTFTTDGGSNAIINLGWEPQWVLVKGSATGTNWEIYDTARELSFKGHRYLFVNDNSPEGVSNGMYLTHEGFRTSGYWGTNRDMVYIAIRGGPARTPTSGTDVYQNYLALSSQTPMFVSGFAADAAIHRYNIDSGGNNNGLSSRLAQQVVMLTNQTGAESNSGLAVAATTSVLYDSSTGIGNSQGLGFGDDWSWMFKRAKGFMDIVCYNGNGVDGTSIPHQLGATPEFMIIKGRNFSDNWGVYHVANGPTVRMQLNSNLQPGPPDYFHATPTETNFFVSADNATNGSGNEYIAYLFATLNGISKVGTFSHTFGGGDTDVDCGFTSGARFILIKRIDSTGNWELYDTGRGIVSGNDPYLFLNLSEAQVTGNDGIDPLSSGFRVANTGYNTGTYAFLAIA